MVEPNRPAVTPAQIIALLTTLLVAGVPALAMLLAAFGVYTFTPSEQDAVTTVLQWGGGAVAAVAAVLVGSDTALRAARNNAHAKVAAVAAVKRTVPPIPPGTLVPSASAELKWINPVPAAALDTLTDLGAVTQPDETAAPQSAEPLTHPEGQHV